MAGFLAHLVDRPHELQHYGKRLLAYTLYAGTSVAVIALVVVGTGTGLIWFGLNVVPVVKWLVVPYVLFGFAFLMFEFMMLRRLALAWGTVVFHPLLGKEDPGRRTVHY